MPRLRFSNFPKSKSLFANSATKSGFTKGSWLYLQDPPVGRAKNHFTISDLFIQRIHLAFKSSPHRFNPSSFNLNHLFMKKIHYPILVFAFFLGTSCMKENPLTNLSGKEGHVGEGGELKIAVVSD